MQGDLRAPKSADTHWRSHDRQATPVLSPEFLSSVFSTVHIGVLNLYLKMSPTALFYWTWPLLFYYWCRPMGTKRGITGASTWFTPRLLFLCLLKGQTADPRVGKGLSRLIFLFLQTNTARINKRYKSSTQTQNGDLCPARIDFTRRFCPSTVAWQEPQWPLTPALEWPQCHPTLGADQPQWASLRLRVAAILCGWSLGQSSVTEAPIELEQSLTKEALIVCFQASC